MNSPSSLLLSNNVCTNCQSNNVKYKCAKCGIQLYCSKDCQVEDWLTHRFLCGLRLTQNNINYYVDKSCQWNLRFFEFETLNETHDKILKFNLQNIKCNIYPKNKKRILNKNEHFHSISGVDFYDMTNSFILKSVKDLDYYDLRFYLIADYYLGELFFDYFIQEGTLNEIHIFIDDDLYSTTSSSSSSSSNITSTNTTEMTTTTTTTTTTNNKNGNHKEKVSDSNTNMIFWTPSYSPFKLVKACVENISSTKQFHETLDTNTLDLVNTIEVFRLKEDYRRSLVKDKIAYAIKKIIQLETNINNEYLKKLKENDFLVEREPRISRMPTRTPYTIQSDEDDEKSNSNEDDYDYNFSNYQYNLEKDNEINYYLSNDIMPNFKEEEEETNYKNQINNNNNNNNKDFDNNEDEDTDIEYKKKTLKKRRLIVNAKFSI